MALEAPVISTVSVIVTVVFTYLLGDQVALEPPVIKVLMTCLVSLDS